MTIIRLPRVNVSPVVREVLAAVVFAWTLLGSGTLVWAWEADVHYGLIKWLAIQAGFSDKDAETIAAGSQTPDDAWILNAIHANVLDICFRRNQGGSEVVKNYHFPSPGHVPDQPKNRQTFPADEHTKATDYVEQVIDPKHYSGGDYERLRAFGLALHPLADSWSHQGIPDHAILCPPDLSWAHPKDRGGWWKHDADFTNLHPDDTWKMAQVVYGYMLKFRSQYPHYIGQDPLDPSLLKLPVEDFAERKTPLTKYDWFLAQGRASSVHPAVRPVPYMRFTTYPCFLRSLSLPRREGLIAFAKLKCAPRKWERKPTSLETVNLPQGLRRDVDKFLRTWIVDGRPGDAVKIGMNFSNAATTLAQGNNQRSKYAEESSFQWMQTVLDSWRFADHGWVNAQGHGMPEEEHYGNLVDPPTNQPRISPKELFDAIHVPGSDQPYWIQDMMDPNSKTPTYLVSFRFKHAPEDAVHLTMVQSGSQWMVEALSWHLH